MNISVGNKGEGEKGDYKGVQRNFWGDGYIHYLDDILWVSTYEKTYRIVYSEYVQLIKLVIPQ